MIKRIHVNQHVIRKNLKHDEDEPCITVKSSRDNQYGKTVTIRCAACSTPAAVVKQSIDKPLSCGARVWIETEGETDIE